MRGIKEGEARTARARESWAELVRRPPVGVLLIGGFLGFLGAGFVLGTAYLAIAGTRLGWLPLAMGAGAGPLVLYVALHLIRLSHWAWLAILLVLALLLASSIWRLTTAPPPPTVPVVEIVLELLALLYLTLPRIRRAFVRR